MQTETLYKKDKIKDAFFLLGIFLLGVILHFWCANYTRALQILPDELRYYDIARSLFQGNGLSMRSFDTDYQKVAYALLLAPFFSIGNGLIRMKMIGLFNAILMMSSVFPAWLLAKELGLKQRGRILVALFLAIWPDMLYACSVMAEILYWPVLLWFLYLWLINQRKKSKILAVILGVLCYVGYLTKEVFLAGLLSLLFIEFIDPCLLYLVKKKQQPGKPQFHKASIGCGLLTLVTFGGCFLLMKLTCFRGMGNSYDQMGLQAIASGYAIGYMLYAFLYFLAATLLAAFVLPVVLPLAHYRDMEEKQRRFHAFLLLYTLITAATVAYTISVRENLGEVVLRIHLRYIAPVIFAYFISFLSWFDGEKAWSLADNNRKKRERRWLLFSGIFLLLLFKGIDYETPIDEMGLNWVVWVQQWVGAGVWTHKVTTTLGIVFALVLLFLMVTFAFLYQRKQKQLLVFFLGVVLVVSVGNGVFAQKNLQQYFQVDRQLAETVLTLNTFLDEQNAEEVMFVSSGFTDLENCMETYIDRSEGFYFISDSYIKDSLQEDEITLGEFIFPTEYYLWDKTYQPNQVEYLIIDAQADLGQKTPVGMEKLEALSNDYYTVYQNIDVTTFQMTR